ncbi:Uncharacterised protein [Delftia tsuruhatensis]|nr:Uncharacterised protein [Delftia tsuruhatensis]CAC9681581.1 Uncharacterised protein [Delftia tsuruhatensis]
MATHPVSHGIRKTPKEATHSLFVWLPLRGDTVLPSLPACTVSCDS